MDLHLMRQRQCRVPTRLTWLLITASLILAIAVGLRHVHTFLAIDAPIGSDYLVIEGWLPDPLLEGLVTAMDTQYTLIITTGGSFSHGSYLLPFRNFADLSAATIVHLGIAPERVRSVPTPASQTNRTYASACQVARWLKQEGLTVRRIDVATRGVHARRTRLCYRQALGPDVLVGVLSVPNPEYDPARWWASSEGAKSVITELIAYVYTGVSIRLRD